MLLACLLMLVAPAQAQRFFNLTSSEVRVDSGVAPFRVFHSFDRCIS